MHTAPHLFSAFNARNCRLWGTHPKGPLPVVGNANWRKGNRDQGVPQVGDICDLRYLYAMPGSGSLYQPVYLGVRDDILAAECTRDQLKFRREEVAA